MAEDVSAVEAFDLVVSWRLGFTNAVTWEPLGSLTSLGCLRPLKITSKNGSLLDNDVMLFQRFAILSKI